MHFVGYATLGSDLAKKQYVGTWVDSTSPYITRMHGSFDAKTSILTMFYTTTNLAGQPEERKNVMVYKGDRREFVGYLKTKGAWEKSMEISYRRMK